MASHSDDPNDRTVAQAQTAQSVKISSTTDTRELPLPGLSREQWSNAWHYLFAFVFAQVAFLVGVFTAFYDVDMGATWKSALMGGAALSIGFGAAMLLYQYLGNSRRVALRAEYAELKERGDQVLAKARQLERQR